MQFQILPDPLAGADVVPVTPQRLKAKVCVLSSLPPLLLLAPPTPAQTTLGSKTKLLLQKCQKWHKWKMGNGNGNLFSSRPKLSSALAPAALPCLPHAQLPPPRSFPPFFSLACFALCEGKRANAASCEMVNCHSVSIADRLMTNCLRVCVDLCVCVAYTGQREQVLSRDRRNPLHTK